MDVTLSINGTEVKLARAARFWELLDWLA